MLASKTKNQKPTNTFKLTFAPQSNIAQLIREYVPLRASIEQLLNRPLKTTYSMTDILTICKKLPKSLQRSTNIQNEVHLCKQIKQIADNFLQPPAKHRYKTYTLYMAFQRFSEILTDRLLHGVKGNFKDIENNPQTLKLFYLTKQLEDINILLEQWAKNKIAKYRRNPSAVSWLCHNEEYKNTNKNLITQPSTAEISRNISRNQKISTLDNCPQRNSQLFFRSSTAKLSRKQAKVAIRCPSAAEVFKKSSFKQPSFEIKRSYRTLKHKSNDCLLTSKTQLKSNTNLFQTPKNSTGELSGQHLTNENETKNDGKQRGSKKYRKVSILNKSSMDQPEQLEHKIRFKPTKRTNNYCETSINKPGNEQHLRKIKRPIQFHFEDQENQQDSKQSDQHQKNEEKDAKTPFVSDKQKNEENSDQDKERVKTSRRGTWKKSTVLIHQCQQSDSNIPPDVHSDQSEQNTEQLPIRLLKKRREKVRRSGKILRKSLNQINYTQLMSIPKKVTHFEKRRKAIMVNQKEQNQLKDQIQIMQENIQNSANQKQLDFDEDVLLGVSQVLKSTQRSLPKIDLQKDKKQPNRATVNDLYGEINQFLKHYQNGAPEQSAGSVFFDQQEQARKIEDQHIRQKMQQMMSHTHSSMSNIFELHCRQENNRQQVYNQIYRHLSFCSDSEWIRNTYSHHLKLAQKPI